MSSPVVIVTAVESGFGFLLTSTILFLVLSHGKKAYHQHVEGALEGYFAHRKVEFQIIIQLNLKSWAKPERKKLT